MIFRSFVVEWLLLALAVSAGCAPAPSTPGQTERSEPFARSPAANAEVPENDPNVTLEVMSYDETMNLVRAHRGRVVVLDVWSTSCPPCIREFPNLVKLHQEYPGEDLACISLNIDYYGAAARSPEDDRPNVMRLLQTFGATFDNVLASEDSDTIRKRMNLTAPPAVFVFDRAGRLAKRFDNDNIADESEAFTYEDVGQLVAKLVAARDVSADQ